MLNLYNRFTSYLLERHPLLWHTKFIQLFGVGLLFWLLSYLIGYGLTDMEVLRNENILNYYEDCYFNLFHIIFVIIALFVWALYFFKNNAIKSFYPLKRGYYTKFFIFLIIAFFTLVSAYIPFTIGTQHKTAHLLPREETEREFQNMELARPFLLLDDDDFLIENRVYPKPFPLSKANYNSDLDQWENLSRYDTLVYTQPYVEIDDKQEYHAVDSSVMTKIGGQWNIFYDKVEKFSSADSCNSEYYMNKFYPLDVEKLRIRRTSILNYDGYYTYDGKTDYSKKYAPIVHDWVLNNRTDKIKASLGQLLRFCNTHGVKHNINQDLLLSYLQKTNYENFVKITNGYKVEERTLNHKDIDHLKSIEKVDSLLINEFENSYRFYLEDDDLEQIVYNYNKIDDKLETDLIFFFLFFSLAFAWFFLLIEVSDLISILITIPVAGVLTIITSLLAILVMFNNRDYYSDRDRPIFILILIVFMLIYALSILLSKKRGVHRIVWNVSMNLSYAITPFVLPLLWVTIRTYFNYSVFGKCDYFSRTENSLPDLNEISILIIAFVSILVFIRFFKSWKAKAE